MAEARSKRQAEERAEPESGPSLRECLERQRRRARGQTGGPTTTEGRRRSNGQEADQEVDNLLLEMVGLRTKPADGMCMRDPADHEQILWGGCCSGAGPVLDLNMTWQSFYYNM